MLDGSEMMRPSSSSCSSFSASLRSRGVGLINILLFLCLLFLSMTTIVLIISSTPPDDCLLGAPVQLDVTESLRGPLSTPINVWIVTALSCVALMEGDDAEMRKALLYIKSNLYRSVSEDQLTKEIEVDGCESFKRSRHYDVQPVSSEELDFPVAFSILVHRDVDQVERLLHTIHRQHNSYCIHVDAKVPERLLRAIRTIANCFSNVFIPQKLESISYAHFSRLQADLSCMQELLKSNRTWRYVINLTGQMFPLKTNLEIVKILRTYEGLNDIEGMSRDLSRSLEIRYKTRFVISDNMILDSGIPKNPPPRNIKLVKGSAYGAFSRPFVEYVLTNGIVKEFLSWTADTYSPDELFWGTLNSRWVNPMFRSPGGHDLPPERKRWLATYVAWSNRDPCYGMFVRDICVFGVADLPILIGRRELFANKFYANFQYLATDCLKEWLANKTKHPQPMDLNYYRNANRLVHTNGSV